MSEKNEVHRIAALLLAAWQKAEPWHLVSQYPESYLATFADMARAVLAQQPQGEAQCEHDLRAEYEGENGARAAICAKCHDRVQTAAPVAQGLMSEPHGVIRRAISYIDFRRGPEDLIEGLRALIAQQAGKTWHDAFDEEWTRAGFGWLDAESKNRCLYFWLTAISQKDFMESLTRATDAAPAPSASPEQSAWLERNCIPVSEWEHGQRGREPSASPGDISQLLVVLGLAGVQVNGGTHGYPWTVKLPSASPAAPTDERALDLYDEIECDLGYLFGRASKEGHEAGQELAKQVMAKMQRARALLAASPADQGEDARWIPVDERLPDAEKDVLVRTEAGYDVAGLFRGEWMSHVTQDYCKYHVTHWRLIDADMSASKEGA